MRKQIILLTGFFLLSGLTMLAGCSKSDDQKKFENEALNTPNDYTETKQNGDIVDKDPDDWRISPRYRGLVTIGEPLTQPPHPNPVLFNQNLTIEIDLGSIETLSKIEVYTFDLSSPNPLYLIAEQANFSTPSLIAISLSGQLISGSSGGSNASKLYRIIIYDGRDNIITYGDVQVQ